MKFRAPKHRNGFTLIELLIVIVVIAILATIVIPKLLGASRRAQEANIVANLGRIRDAVERFQADTGVYPIELTDILATKASDVKTDIPPSTFRGAYISTEGGIPGCGLPRNPFITESDTDYTHHWKYDPADGTVTVPDSQANITMTDGRKMGQL